MDPRDAFHRRNLSPRTAGVGAIQSLSAVLRWYILYSAGSSHTNSDQRSFVLKDCSQNPYDCDYSFQAELTPPPSGQGGPNGNDPWPIDGTYLTTRDSRYHVVSAHDSNGDQSIQIATLDTSDWTVGNWNVISMPTEPWEMANQIAGKPAAVNEGPNPLYHDGNILLSFSASWCGTSTYSLGLLAYDGHGGPLDKSSWTKTGPALSSAK